LLPFLFLPLHDSMSNFELSVAETSTYLLMTRW